MLILFLGLIGGAIAVARYYTGCQQTPAGGGDVSFTVPGGASGEDVMASLHDEGLVPCAGFVGNLLLRSTGKAGEIRAGTYDLSVGMNLDEILTVLTTPPKDVPTSRLTVPPGYRLTQIAEQVEKALGIPANEFLKRADEGNWSLEPYLADGEPLEGFLYPETYAVPKKDTADEVIERLLDQFAATATDLPWDNAESLGVTPYEVVIIASMIEEEAAVKADRPLIAGVIYNRLKLGMTLGIDATLLYDDPTPETGLTDEDLQSDSPYNTRVHAGLPPTPIASPYAWSLRAALEPADTDYLYYVLCGDDGSHQFAKTYEEHLRYVSECLP